MKGYMEIDVKELKKFRDNLVQARDKIKAEAVRVMNLNADRMVADIKGNTPLDTGLLRNSFERSPVMETADSLEAVVSTNVEYAPFVEYGYVQTPRWVPGHFKGDRFVYEPNAKTGIFVGRDRKFIRGHFMVTEAENRVRSRLDRDVKELINTIRETLR